MSARCPLLEQDLASVLVAVERASGRMVSTVRIFRRELRIASGEVVAVGGLGEVSTLPAFRKRGPSSRPASTHRARMTAARAAVPVPPPPSAPVCLTSSECYAV